MSRKRQKIRVCFNSFPDTDHCFSFVKMDTRKWYFQAMNWCSLQHRKNSVTNYFEQKTPVESCDLEQLYQLNGSPMAKKCCLISSLRTCSWPRGPSALTVVFMDSSDRDLAPQHSRLALFLASGRISELKWLSDVTFPLINKRMLWSKYCVLSLLLYQA